MSLRRTTGRSSHSQTDHIPAPLSTSPTNQSHLPPAQRVWELPICRSLIYDHLGVGGTAKLLPVSKAVFEEGVSIVWKKVDNEVLDGAIANVACMSRLDTYLDSIVRLPFRLDPWRARGGANTLRHHLRLLPHLRFIDIHWSYRNATSYIDCTHMRDQTPQMTFYGTEEHEAPKRAVRHIFTSEMDDIFVQPLWKIRRVLDLELSFVAFMDGDEDGVERIIRTSLADLKQGLSIYSEDRVEAIECRGEPVDLQLWIDLFNPTPQPAQMPATVSNGLYNVNLSYDRGNVEELQQLINNWYDPRRNRSALTEFRLAYQGAGYPDISLEDLLSQGEDFWNNFRGIDNLALSARLTSREQADEDKATEDTWPTLPSLRLNELSLTIYFHERIEQPHFDHICNWSLPALSPLATRLVNLAGCKCQFELTRTAPTPGDYSHGLGAVATKMLANEIMVAKRRIAREKGHCDW